MSASFELDAKEIIWDLDGTLIDSFGITKDVLSEVFNNRGIEIPGDDVFEQNYHGTLDELITVLLGSPTSEDIAEIVKEFLVIQNNHYEIIEHHIFPDALNLAKRAHKAGLTQVMVTNRLHQNRLLASPRSIVERSDLRNYIDVIVSGDDTKYRKPNPEVVSALVNNGTLNLSETVVIGDQFVDAQFAKNLGARALLVCRKCDTIPHMERLSEDWSKYATIVSSLNEVSLR